MSNRVRELRIEQGMLQRELAEKAGLSMRTIGAVEKGLPCRMATMRRILIALGFEYSADARRAVFGA